MRIKQKTACPRYIFKINSGRLRKAKWKLTLPLAEARKNNEIIALADSQVLRWLDELNGISDADERACEIRREIRRLRRGENSIQNRKAVRQLYQKLDAIQFKPDYMCLIIDKEKDYWRACKGFSINGISYKRLLGTPGGIKNSTIVFISERHIDEIRRRIDNGRDMSQKLIPAKLEAYKALACSASTPVSWPNGILVVKDFETVFHEDIIYLSDENDGEPEMEYRDGEEIRLNGSDGFGLMLPSLAERWSRELGLDYTVSGVCSRASFEKGMLFTFDFLDFAENVAHRYTVTDVWGHERDIRDVELIFTEGMLKLWGGYRSIEHYISCCMENGYTICVTKTCPEKLEHMRRLNYQFIQPFELSDEDIEELIGPTMDEIRGVLGGDWAKTVLYMAGAGVGETEPENMRAGLPKAIMVDRRVMDDPHVIGSVYQLIRNRIDEAKIGVLNVHGNYSIISGDPYALCQSIFGMEITGLLKAGEIYSRYWLDNSESDELICFRAPMSVRNNIRKVKQCRRDEAAYWYRYIRTGTILNSWDTITAALNGADFDADMVMLTDNPVLLRRHVATRTILCVQRKAEKVIPTEEMTVRSNLAAFGDEIGKITNWVTSMYDVQSNFKPGSREYVTLAYRIMVGQLKQQASIDKAKGIVAKPMTREWYDRHAVNQMEDEEKQRFYRSIVADRKPYFMRYIYPLLKRDYKDYIRKADATALREFKMTVDEIAAIPYSELSERQKEFLRYYDLGMPVGMGECVVNRICRRFEEEFDGYVGRAAQGSNFDASLYKSGTEYKTHRYYAIKKLFDDYSRLMRQYFVYAKSNGVDRDEMNVYHCGLIDEFRRECFDICQNQKEMVDMLIDIWYRKRATNSLLWTVCPEQIVENLLDKNGREISVPVRDDCGEILFGGERYTIKNKKLEGSDEYSPE